ncbi:MAG: group II truncated hemoglobin [Burkholderiales bacterium]|nr:group II truncated hemoglobin [Rhodocyclaceae bacterium]MCA3020760.1 group II truncated hemoglobin [Rhodocyclaceae bacterium]MCA3024566.1 group II truncated hemoglobin [Rhodocyclaceae bacterium]MCA3030432.1 group II truncated hemoglobin [Rhodocyclaceae bacterium]MCA3036958.1 group II truncated hemoglobin [Rhodocyclaceae bacterium]
MTIEEPTDPGQSPYLLLGGEAAVRRLVDAFYDQMDEDPDFFGIRKLHPASLAASRDKLYMFLTGWLGGPPLYTSEFGHPRLRARHLPFAIGEAERDQWMACMAKALEVVGIELSMRERLIASFANTADWMRNREG